MKKNPHPKRKNPNATLQTLLETLHKGEAPSRFERRLLLPTPPAIPLSQLGADLRTTNSLAQAGYDRNPTRIGKLTVGEAMQIEGFGRQCLISYLEASQNWKRLPAQRPAKPADDPSGTLAYLQAALARARGDEIGLLHDYQLVEPYHVPVEALALKTRTTNGLSRLKLGPDRKLGNLTIGDLLKLDVFGPVSLIDLLENLAATYEKGLPRARLIEPGSPGARKIADRIEAALGGHELLRSDPRLGRMFKQLGASTSRELLKMLRSSKCETPITLQSLKRFVKQLEECGKLTLEQEATQLRRRKEGSRADQLVRAYFGFGMEEAATLESVAIRWSVTRERIRQIAMPTKLRKTAAVAFMPALQRVLKQIRQLLPNMCAELEADMVKRGWLEEGTTIGEIIRYAKRTTGIPTGLAEQAVGLDRIVLEDDKLHDFLKLSIRERLRAGHHGRSTRRIEYRPRVKITRLFV